MDTNYLATFLAKRLDEMLPHGGYYCALTGSMAPYRETSSLVYACGHDTAELDRCISAVEKAIADLKAAREKAVVKFKADGVCFIVDETRRREIEQARLQ
jgi:hypothetical protein